MTAEEYVKHYATGQGGFVSVSLDVALMAIEYAKQEAKQQIMKDAVEATVLENYDGKVLSYDEALMDNKNLCHCCVGDKVKVIIIKTED